ncbi:hypothetical protein JCM10212_006099 [Sporobolomyces blumeae]
MSCSVVSPSASPRVGYPAHRTAAPLVSILRSNPNPPRTPLASPRTPAGLNAARIEAAVTDYFSAGTYEGSTRTPMATPAVGLGFVGGGGGASVHSPRTGFAFACAASSAATSKTTTTRALDGLGLDLALLDASLACLVNASPALSSTQSPYLGSISFAAAGTHLSHHRQSPVVGVRSPRPNPSSSSSSSGGGLASRRRPSLRISDLPPLVMPDVHLSSLSHLSIPTTGSMTRGDSDASATTTCSELTLTDRLEHAGQTPGGYGTMVGLGLGAASSPGGGGANATNGKRIPTPYPERKAWLEDGDVGC